MNCRLANLFARIPKPTRRIAAIILAQKIVFAILLILAPVLVPSFFPNARVVERRFRTLDSDSYLQISTHGYTSNGAECAFYPLWPLCIRIGSFLTGGNMVLAGYLLANLLSFAGLLLFHRYVWEKHNLVLADRATTLMLFFPGSIFFFFPYTESLFFFLVMIFLFKLHRTNYTCAAVTAFFLPMARAIGILLLPVLVWELFRKKSLPKRYLACAGPVLGYLCYFGIMYSYTGNALEGFNAQRNYPAQPSLSRIADIVGFIVSFADFGWSHDMLHSFVDRGFFLVFVCSLYWVIRMDSTYYLYSVFTGLIPALSNVLMSYTRFLSLVFPVFVVLAQLTLRKWVYLFLCGLSGAVQVCFLVRHVSDHWVG
jgi:ABC-type multidrug transport system fused ATPase/permease subunit